MSTNHELKRIKTNLEWIRQHIVNKYPISAGDFQILQRFLADPSSNINIKRLKKHIKPYNESDGVTISPEAYEIIMKRLEEPSNFIFSTARESKT